MSSVAVASIEAPRVRTPRKADGTTYSKGYNPSPIRRRVDRDGVPPGGVVHFRSKSHTRPNVDPKTGAICPTHTGAVDLETREVTCTCEHFKFRLAKMNPTLRWPHLWCKHILSCVEGCERRGEVEVYRDRDGIIEAVPTGYSFDVPVEVEAGVEDYDANDEAYWREAMQRAEVQALAEAEAEYRA